MSKVNPDEAKARLDDLLERAAGGEDVVIERGDGAAFRLVPRRRVAGLRPGAIEMGEDFDEPLPDRFRSGKASLQTLERAAA